MWGSAKDQTHGLLLTMLMFRVWATSGSAEGICLALLSYESLLAGPEYNMEYRVLNRFSCVQGKPIIRYTIVSIHKVGVLSFPQTQDHTYESNSE